MAVSFTDTVLLSLLTDNREYSSSSRSGFNGRQRTITRTRLDEIRSSVDPFREQDEDVDEEDVDFCSDADIVSHCRVLHVTNAHTSLMNNDEFRKTKHFIFTRQDPLIDIEQLGSQPLHHKERK